MKFHPRLQILIPLAMSMACPAAISLNSGELLSAGDSSESLAQESLPQADGPAAEANKAFSEGRFGEAVELALPLAEKEDADALFLLGLAHESGQGLERSQAKAIEYYRKAFAKGHQDARYRTSLILLASDDKAEREDARKMLETAAKTDPAVAGRILGEGWLIGRLSEKPDPAKASEWWQRAATAGDLASMRILAGFYEGRLGYPEFKDAKKAIGLYEQAAAKGDVESMVVLASRLLMGEESLRDEKRGRELLEKVIEMGNFGACLVLGEFEEAIKKDDKAALAAYERGKDGGQLECMVRAGDFYLQGRGTKKDETRGTTLLVNAAQAGHPQAQFRVAMSILSSEKPDIGAAYLNLLAAANSGMAAAQNELGLFYLSGKMGVADQAAAVGWLTRAAKLGHAAAQNNLATLYEAGAAGLNQDYKNAIELYSLAARQGHAEATTALIRLYSEGPIDKDLPRAWALASIAVERGQDAAKEAKAAIEAKLDKQQLADAKKLLEKLKEPAK